jgi:hypothetical protein
VDILDNPERDISAIDTTVKEIIEAELSRQPQDWGRVLKQIRKQTCLPLVDAYLILRNYRKNGRNVYPPGLTFTTCIAIVLISTDLWILINEFTGNHSNRLAPCVISIFCVLAILIVEILRRRRL